MKKRCTRQLNENTRQAREKKKIAREELNKKRTLAVLIRKSAQTEILSVCAAILAETQRFELFDFKCSKSVRRYYYCCFFFCYIYAFDVNNSFWESDQKKVSFGVKLLTLDLFVRLFFYCFSSNIFLQVQWPILLWYKVCFELFSSVCSLFLCFDFKLHNFLMLCVIENRSTIQFFCCWRSHSVVRLKTISIFQAAHIYQSIMSSMAATTMKRLNWDESTTFSHHIFPINIHPVRIADGLDVHRMAQISLSNAPTWKYPR